VPGRLDTRVAAALAAVVVAVVVFHVALAPDSPPGFIRDEAAFSVNATTLARSLEDQDGARLPLFFTSFADWKPPVYPYLLAAVFRVTGADADVARGVATAAVLVAMLLLGLLAWRLTGSALVTGLSLALAGTTPWLFELGRVAFDVALIPAVVLTLLLAVEWARRSPRSPVVRGIPVGLALGLLAYTYAAGRLLAPLYALALLVFLGRPGLRFLASAWTTLAVVLLPMAFYVERHPGALTARYEATRFPEQGSALATLRHGAANYLQDLNAWRWVRDGDPKPYTHTWGAGQLYAASVVLAVAGVVVLVRRRRLDAWWGYVVAVLLLTAVPAALTEDRLHSARLAPLPAILAVVAIPGLAALVDAARRTRWAQVAAAALVLVTVVQLANFVEVYSERGRSSRLLLFEANVPALLERAFARDGPVYVDYDDRAALTHAQWYAVAHGQPFERVVRLPDGAVAPTGATVFGRVQACDYVCRRIASADTYWVAEAVGPKPA
jgi:4-amino-4-deoxy-L-arabinose transferase-like glycosyltransferase